MSKFQWVEVFSSIEGEGPYTGHPTAYIRFTKCNFTCRRFNNPDDLQITNDVLGFDPANYSKLTDLPPIEIGCDSIYAWDNRFKHLWHEGDENDLSDALIDTIPNNQWKNPSNGKATILSLTGGEPTLRAKQIPQLINHPALKDVEIILIETNCSVPLKDDFLMELNRWGNPRRKVVWSNSPKLSPSGEDWDKAIVPEVAKKQRLVKDSEQYFKFVCGPRERDFNEVAKAMEAYVSAGIPADTDVYIMPESCITGQQNEISAAVAQMCMERGYIYCHRVHLDVFDNAIGT